MDTTAAAVELNEDNMKDDYNEEQGDEEEEMNEEEEEEEAVDDDSADYDVVDDDDEYEYEADDDNYTAGFLVDNPDAAAAAMVVEDESTTTRTTTATKQGDAHQYSEQAIKMSRRIETEKTAGKRRLASDLHKLMSQDTAANGFVFEPTNEDCMDKWTIQMSQFDEDSDLAKDMLVLGLSNIQLEMKFPNDYPFEPPFVRVISPRFVRRTGFVVSGALCMELLTKDGWRPTCDIESVIVSIRSLMVEGGGRLEAASTIPKSKYNELLKAAKNGGGKPSSAGKDDKDKDKTQKVNLGSYSEWEAKDGYMRATMQHRNGSYSDDITRKG